VIKISEISRDCQDITPCRQSYLKVRNPDIGGRTPVNITATALMRTLLQVGGLWRGWNGGVTVHLRAAYCIDVGTITGFVVAIAYFYTTVFFHFYEPP
jgi:hypothetical protein